jgi:phosphatidylserine/phosphatidylglycerophosphate/cardiolipin synthase-like enzyme
MYFNNAICDLYVGTGAGKKLMEDIGNAKRSVKIISPYLSPYLVRKLIDLHYQGIQVNLITSDAIRDFYGAGNRLLYQLVHQDQSMDHEKKALLSKWKRWKFYLQLIFIVGTLLACGIAFLLKDRLALLSLFAMIPVLFLIQNYTSKIKNADIYRYQYRELFPLKVCQTPKYSSYSHPFIHSKMYIIDDEIAYLGSLNFTANGTKNNYETRIRISDQRAVKGLNQEFKGLFYNGDIPELELEDLGRELYLEVGL